MTFASYPYGAFPFGGLGADELEQELTIEERIEAPAVGQAFPNDATWVVPVSIRYYLFA
jgi:hypothetical protein